MAWKKFAKHVHGVIQFWTISLRQYFVCNIFLNGEAAWIKLGICVCIFESLAIRNMKEDIRHILATFKAFLEFEYGKQIFQCIVVIRCVS